MAEREVTIVIKGKNLTQAEFDKARKDLAGVDDQAKKTSAGMGSLGNAFQALGAVVSIGAVTAAIRSYADFTGQLSDMSAKTGIGVEALQRLKYAAELNGGSLDQVSKAVTKLGANLAGGDASAAGALKALGLSFTSVRAMAPDKAFTTIADAIAKVPDPMAQSKLAMDLFGKAGAEMLPMMKGNLSETAAAADRLGIVLSDDAVRAGDAFGDTMTSLGAVGQSLIAQVLTPMIPTLTTIAQWLGEKLPGAVKFIVDALSIGLGRAFLEADLLFNQFLLGVAEGVNSIPLLGKAIGFSSQTITGLRGNVDQANNTLAAFTAQTVAGTASNKKAATTMGALNLNYDANEKSVAKAAAATLKAHKSLAEWNQEVDKQNATMLRGMATIGDFTKEIEKYTDRVAKGTIGNALARKQYESEMNQMVRQSTTTRINFEIEEIGRWAANEKLKLDQSVGNWQAAAKAIDDVAAAKVTKLIDDDNLTQMVLFANLNTEAAQKVKQTGLAAKAAAYGGLSEYFISIAQIAGPRGIGTLLSSLGQMFVGFRSATSWANQLGADNTKLGGSFGSLSVAFNDNAKGSQRFAAGVQAAGAITQGAINIWNAASSATTRLGASFNGAMAGMQAGAAFGPWGAAAGAAVGVVAGLFQDKVKKAVQAANAEIDKTKDKLLGTYGTLENLDAAAARVGLSFKENWGQQGKAGLEAFNKLAEQLEQRLKAVDAANTLAINGFGAVVTGMTKPWAAFGEKLDASRASVLTASQEYETLRASGTATGDQLAAAAQKVRDAGAAYEFLAGTQRQLAVDGKQQLADLGIQAIGTFGAAMVAGKSYGDAMAAVGPSIATLGQSYKTLGLDVEDVGLKQLILQSTVAKGNPELIAATSGLGSSMQGLAQLGMLNVDSFAAMQRTGSAMYARLQGEVNNTADASMSMGDKSRAALQPMQGYLQQAATQAELLGLPLDANTQMLINQSKELGIWKDKGKSAQDLLIDGMNKMVDRVDRLLQNMLGFSGAITNLPAKKDIEINVTENVSRNVTTNDIVGDGVEWGGPQASGGDYWVTRPTLFLAGEAGPERATFTPKSQAGSASAGSAAGAAPGVKVYIVGDTSREARIVSESEFKQIQARLDGGGLQVPARAITSRGR